MLKAAHIHDLWVLQNQVVFKKVAKRVNVEQEEFDKISKADAFAHWHEIMLELRKKKAEEDQQARFVDILRNSTRGQRSTMEKEEIRRFISTHLSCIPKSINFSEMDTLCNELDWIPYIGRQILFLQGDFGNCYYMIGCGRVGLYLEPSKDREMVIAREFGHQRLQPFQGTDEDLQQLGQNIVNLPQGAGFGEFAILASSNKIRSCAAVSLDENSMLLVMHAETYNAVLRQHHYRQKQLSSATALLQELPLFRHQNYSKVASIAYTMRSQTYSNQTMIVGYGDTIQTVMLVSSGQVKVYAPPSAEEVGNNSKLLQKRIPKLAIAMLGRGQIIGEMEVQKGLTTFQMTYESGAAGTEVLEMPLAVFQESISSGGLTQSMMYKSIEEMNSAKEQRRVGRMTRAYDAMKSMMGKETRVIESKEQLVRVLPALMDQPISAHKSTTTPNKESAIHALHGGPKRRGVGSYYGDERPSVERRSSFAVHPDTLTDPRDPTATNNVSGTGGGSVLGAATGSLKFTMPIRKASMGSVSPRKSDFTSSPTRAQSVVLTKSPFAHTPAPETVGNINVNSNKKRSSVSTASPVAASPSKPRPSALMGSPRLSVARQGIQ